jgi:shikimate kinase
VLVGLPGAGKTAAGRLAAERLGGPFVDLDAAVEQRAGRSIAAIFAAGGEAAFRVLEAAAGRDALLGEAAVIATGGGFLMEPASRRLAHERGFVVHLAVGPETAARRLAGLHDRPLLETADRVATLRGLLAARQSLYLEAAEQVTTDGLTLDEVADRLAALARSRGGW